MSLLVGPFEVEELRRLGSGGMAEVWLARLHHASGVEQVALKRIRSDLRDRPEFEGLLRREARLCGALIHPHIVALRAWGIDEKGPYLALEYVEGHTASALLRKLAAQKLPLPLEVVLSIAREAASALDFAHRFVDPEGPGSGIIHRDVSPDNLLLSAEGTTKLTDFGIAKLEGSTTMTRTGTVKGKLGYLAPELFDGAEADVSTDVFALGVTLYKLTCNVAPFYGRTDAETLRAVLHSEPARLRKLRTDVPAKLDELVHRCLHRDRTRRPKTVAEVQLVLEELTEGAESSFHPAVAKVLSQSFSPSVAEETAPALPLRTLPVRRSAQPHPSRRRRVVAGIGVGLALGAVALFALRSHRPDLAAQTARPPASPAAPATVSQAPANPAPTELPEPAPVPLPVPVAAPVPAPVPARARAPGTPAPPEHPSRVAAPQAKPRLWVKVSPWAEVFIDGRSAGITPLAPASFPAGKHSIVLINPRLGVRRRVEVNLKPGETRVVNVILDAQKTSVTPAPRASPPAHP